MQELGWLGSLLDFYERRSRARSCLFSPILKALAWQIVAKRCQRELQGIRENEQRLADTGRTYRRPSGSTFAARACKHPYGSQLARGIGMRIAAHSNIDRVSAGDFALLANDMSIATKRLADEAANLRGV